ncbi:MAG TPA: hypothetical protein ENG03_01105 [Thioploca sp.]|nr:hypothetical protein [Thioploca sp.]
MSNIKLTNKKNIMGAALLATAPTVKAADPCLSGQGVATGCKSQRGINHLTLEEAPLENIILCVPGKSTAGLTGDFRFLPDKLAVVIPPFEKNFVKMTFIVSHMTSSDDKRILFLLYSPKTSPSPQINTPRSLEKLGLDLSAAEIVGVYDVPPFGMEKQTSTRIGVGNPAARVKWEFDINLDTSEIPTMMNSGKDTIYVQAGLIKRSDFEKQNFDGMILSEMDTIQFVPNKCPDLMDGQRVDSIDLDNPGSGKDATTGNGSSGGTDGK